MLTETQRQKRQQGLGGSDIGAVLGLSRYKTPYTVYLEKTGQAPEQPDNKYMKMGRLLEPVVIQLYEEAQACQVNESDTLTDTEYDFLIGHVDGIVDGTRIVLECKTAQKSPEWGTPGTNEIPPVYLTQVAHYAYLADAEKVDIAVLFMNTRDYEIYVYERNEQLENLIRQSSIKFWQEHVLKKIPPEPHTINDCQLIFNEVLPESKIANNDMQQIIVSYQAIQADIKEKSKELDELKQAIMAYMGQHQQLVDAHQNILATWNKRKGASYFDVNKFKKGHPQLLDQYMARRTDTRTLRIH